MVALPQLRAWEHVMLKPSHPAALQAPGSKMPLGRRPDALTRQEAEVLTRRSGLGWNSILIARRVRASPRHNRALKLAPKSEPPSR